MGLRWAEVGFEPGCVCLPSRQAPVCTFLLPAAALHSGLALTGRFHSQVGTSTRSCLNPHPHPLRVCGGWLVLTCLSSSSTGRLGSGSSPLIAFLLEYFWSTAGRSARLWVQQGREHKNRRQLSSGSFHSRTEMVSDPRPGCCSGSQADAPCAGLRPPALWLFAGPAARSSVWARGAERSVLRACPPPPGAWGCRLGSGQVPGCS